MYCTQRVPQQLRQDPVLWGECLAGALYWNDFLRLARECGFADPRLVTSSPVSVANPQLQAAIAQHMPATATATASATASASASASSDGTAQQPLFYSATYRLFKIAELEPDSEDYGQAVMYLGTIPYPEVERSLPPPLPLHLPAAVAVNAYVPLPVGGGGEVEGHSEGNGACCTNTINSSNNGNSAAGTSTTIGAPAVKLMSCFALDEHNLFPAGKVVPVCGNTYRMLRDTRMRPHFQFIGGDFSQHFGIFKGRGKSMPFQK